MVSRRAFLAGASFIAFRNDTLGIVERLVNRVDPKPADVAQDEAFWVQIQEAFTLDRTMVNLNNGGVSPSPRVVQETLKRYLDYSNQAPSYYMWRHLETEIESVRRRLAQAFGCDPEEVAITRNASEALEICLNGIDLNPGDEILTTTLDYPRMINTIKQRERRENVRMVQVRVPPVPNSHRQIVDIVRLGVTPRTKIILVSQVAFQNGQIFPVSEICNLGRRIGIPVIVDGAHAFAQFPFAQKDLACDYYGTSLHKWLMAPVGTGMLYVKRDKIPGLWSLMASTDEQSKDIRKFEEIGTHPAANHNAIAEALTFHELIGPERKEARLRALRARWVDRLKENSKFRFHTNLKPEHSCGLTTVQLLGIEPPKLAEWLWDRHRIFIVAIDHPDFKGLRVTPNVYTTLAEIDRFASAMLLAAKEGIPAPVSTP